jgi:dienelactone hydrolase
MRKIIVSLSLLLLLFLVTPTFAQLPLVGHWEGVVSREGKDWRIWLDISGGGDASHGTIDVPDYGLYAMKLDEIRVDGREVYLERKDSSGSVIFKGSILDKSFTGEFEGLGLTAKFRMTRTLTEPLDFVEEEVKFQNGVANLVGTLVKPRNTGKFPVIVFTHGSGNQTRGEDFYHSRAYLFARNGIAALIYDRRGKGSSTGGADKVRFEDLADDAISAVRYLKNRKDVIPHQIGISGFSQGGYVSPLAATRSMDIAFVIVGSAPGITPDEQNDFNVENTLRSKQVPEVKITAVMNLRQKLRKYQFSGVGDKTALEFEIKGLRAESWYRYALLPQEEIRVFNKGEKEFLLFDPAKIWEKVTVPVLAIWGKEDLLVPAERSCEIFENALKRAGNKDYTLKIFSNSGHGLSVVRGNDEPWDWYRMAPGYQELMVSWLQQRVDEMPVRPAARP